MIHHTKKPSPQSNVETLVFFLLVLFVFLCPFVYLKGLYNYVRLPQSALVQTFSILFGLVVFLTRAVFKHPLEVKQHPLNIAVFCFIGWTFVSSVYAHNHYEAFNQWVNWAACIGVFFLSQQVLSSDHRVFKMLAAIYAAGLLTAIIGIGQYLFGIDIIPQSAPPSATFANKNMAAQFIVLTLPLGMSLLCWAKQKTDVWFAAISSGIMMVFLVYTQTRAAWVAVFFEIILIFAGLTLLFLNNKTARFWDKDKTIATLVGIFLILLCVNIGPDGVKWQFPSLFNRVVSVFDHRPNLPVIPPSEALPSNTKDFRNTDKDSGSVRLAIWKNTLEMIKKKPVTGVGLGNHKIYYPLFHATAVKEEQFSETHQLSNVHNDFLQFFSETGLIGGLVVVFVFLSFFKLTAKTLCTRTDSVFFAVMGVGVSVAGILVNSCFSFPFEMPIPPLIVMIYFAIVLCVSQPTGYPGIKVPEKGLAVLIVLCVPLLWYSVRYYDRDITCDRNYLQAKTFETRREWTSVIAAANAAYALNPNRKKILSYAARGYIETGDYQKGIDALQTVIKAYPYHMNALLNLGVAYSGLNQHDTAMGYYQKVLDIKPDFSKAHMNIAGIYMGQKQYDKAVASFQTAAVTEPDNAMILYNMGLCQVYLKQYEQAARILERTVAINPAWPNAQLNLAILYYQYLNKKKQSVLHFKKALEQNPNVQNRDQIKKIIDHK
ncbi:O-antigen ligase family protein [Desulfobacula sp.]|uniref:O-antigen ligase family protein n=1 Tax=Desulfobacula sp. TaxID=2593537 RepID=UPI00260F315A|nr:O-antigen ligase family protein [Desulfobacula sp.]